MATGTPWEVLTPANLQELASIKSWGATCAVATPTFCAASLSEFRMIRSVAAAHVATPSSLAAMMEPISLRTGESCTEESRVGRQP